MAESSQLDQAIDELYGLRPGEFVAARDALAKRLRAEGRRDEADAVRKRARPTVAAWAVNLLVRTEPEWTQALATAGERLQEAQTALMERGDREAWSEATAAQREVVDRLTRLSEDLVRKERGNVTASVRDAIRETLLAATIDADARAQVCAGRLERELRAVGLLGGDLSAVAPAAPARTKRSRSASASPSARASAPKKKPAKRPASAIREEQAARRAAEKEARAALRQAERRLGTATTRARRADQAAQRARKALDAARAALADAEQAAADRARELETAEEHQRQAGRERDELQAAVEAAREALERVLKRS